MRERKSSKTEPVKFVTTFLMTQALILSLSACDGSPQPFNYCALPTSPSNSDKYKANIEVPQEVLFMTDKQKIESLHISEDDVVDIHRNPAIKNTRNVIFVPIGYTPDQVSHKLPTYLENIAKAYHDIPVTFMYLKYSVPVGVKHVDRLPLIDNDAADTVFEKLAAVSTIDKIVFLMNTDGYYGGTGIYATVTGENAKSLSTSIHEIGHMFGLDDEYPRYYNIDVLSGTGLFTSTAYLRPDVQAAYQEIDPPFGQTSGVCNQWPVYNFYPDQYNVMRDKGYTNDQAIALMQQGLSFFTPLQKQLMTDYINGYYSTR